MDNNFEKFIGAYNKSDQDTRNIIDSDQIGLFVDILLNNTEYTNLKMELIVITSNKLLGIFSDKDIPDQLTKLGVNNETTQVMSIKILDFVKASTNEAGKPFTVTAQPTKIPAPTQNNS